MYRREVTAHVRWLGYGLLAVSVAAVFLPVWAGSLARRLLLVVPGVVLGLSLIDSGRTGAVRPTVVVGIAAGWVALTVSGWTDGGVVSDAYIGYLVPILGAAVLLGSRTGVAVCALSIAAGFAMACAEVRGWLPRASIPSSPFTHWSERSVVMAIAMLILSIADTAVQAALRRAHDDLDERRRAEGQATETARRLAVAMQAARMAAWEWDLDRDRITWSEKAGRLLGGSSRGLVSKFDEAAALVHPDDREKFRRIAASAAARRPSGTIRMSQRLLASDGSSRWFEEVGQYFPPADGRPARIIGVILDISERRRIEDLQLAITRGLSTQSGADVFRTLVVHLAGALRVDVAFIGELSADRRTVRTLAAWADGATTANFDYELDGAPCEQVITGGLCSYPSGVQQRFPRDPSLAQRSIDGYAGQPLLGVAGTVIGVVVVMSRRPLQNLSELESVLRAFGVRAAGELERMRVADAQNALEEQLRQSQKMETIGQLAGGVAHDFNNLLTPILGYTELLLSDVHSDERRRDYLETIREAAERASALTRQLLTFGRRQVLDLRSLSLNDAVSGFERILRRTTREEIALEFRYSPAPAWVRGDLSQIEQVLMNLVVNAQDAIAASGTIVVATGEMFATGEAGESGAAAPRFVTLSVTDTGRGMTPDTLRRAFEPFFTTKEKGHGTGLGLATVYGIVRQHQGRVAIDSRPGAGTRVLVSLPAAECGADASATAAAAVPASRPVADAQGLVDETILVVEDDEMVRNLACAVLRPLGYGVIEFPGPDACLGSELARTCGAALLLTDIVMPGMNGRDLYERLRVWCPGIKVLYMSGYADSVIADRGVVEAGVELLPKPFSVGALAARVRSVLDAPAGMPARA